MELEPVEVEEADPVFAVSSGIGLVYAERAHGQA
jgi:hypothetical protein